MATTTAVRMKKRDCAPIVRAAFPEYKGRTFRLSVSETLMLHNVHWDGGSRNEYVAVELGTGRAAPARLPAPWFVPGEGLRVDLPVGSVVVEHSVWCGKDVGITIHSNPANIRRLLAAAPEERATEVIDELARAVRA